MSRTICFIDKDGMCGTCSEEALGKDTIDCNNCPFKKQFEGKEKDNFTFCKWLGELKDELDSRGEQW